METAVETRLEGARLGARLPGPGAGAMGAGVGAAPHNGGRAGAWCSQACSSIGRLLVLWVSAAHMAGFGVSCAILMRSW